MGDMIMLFFCVQLPDCLRGIDVNFGSKPPNKANRLALSRSTKTRKPSCTNAVLSCKPVNSAACAYRSSSIFRVNFIFSVVLIQVNLIL